MMEELSSVSNSTIFGRDVRCERFVAMVEMIRCGGGAVAVFIVHLSPDTTNALRRLSQMRRSVDAEEEAVVAVRMEDVERTEVLRS